MNRVLRNLKLLFIPIFFPFSIFHFQFNYCLCGGKRNKTIELMNDLEPIQRKIYEIRGYRVMLDFDLAAAYGVETKQLKRQVRRNIERFEGEDFMFEVTREELIRCQIGTIKAGRGQHIKYLPFAFTELGVAMLSSVLTSPIAIDINRRIMRAFVAVRQALPLINSQKALEDLQQRVKALEESGIATQAAIEETRMELAHIYDALTQLEEKKNDSLPEIGYAAIQKRREEENKK